MTLTIDNPAECLVKIPNSIKATCEGTVKLLVKYPSKTFDCSYKINKERTINLDTNVSSVFLIATFVDCNRLNLELNYGDNVY